MNTAQELIEWMEANRIEIRFSETEKKPGHVRCVRWRVGNQTAFTLKEAIEKASAFDLMQA